MRRRTKSRWGEGKRWRGRRVVLGKGSEGKKKEKKQDQQEKEEREREK